MGTTLIVGQGIAGTLLTHFLLQAGGEVLVIDDAHQGASSRAAAGVINPITGRHYVKSWRVDELLPFARQTYQALEQQLGSRFYHERHVLRTMSSPKEVNDWSLRTLEPNYAPYIAEDAEPGAYARHTTPPLAYGEVLQGAQVNLPLLIQRYQHFLAQENCLQLEWFDFAQLVIQSDGIRYKNHTADRIIFCDGAKAKTNPFFCYLPFHGDKGEALIVRIPGARFEKILKQQIFIVPLGADDLYWVGATYQRHFANDQPSEYGLNFLQEHLNAVLNIPYEIVEHWAAIRPTVRDRRPLLGLHPRFPQLGIFNGLGTKGASLGPYWAKHFTDFLTQATPIDAEVDIQRFLSFLPAIST